MIIIIIIIQKGMPSGNSKVYGIFLSPAMYRYYSQSIYNQCAASPLQSNREQHILVRLNLDNLGLGQDMVTRAHQPAKLRLPVRHIPLEALCGNDARLLDGDDADVLVKDVLVSVTMLPFWPHVDVVTSRLEQHRKRLAANEVHSALGICGVCLEEVQVVELAKALVDSAAQAAHGDNVEWLAAVMTVAVGVMCRRSSRRGRGQGADIADSFAEIRRVLVRVVDDLRGLCGRGGGKVGACFRGDGVQVTYYHV